MAETGDQGIHNFPPYPEIKPLPPLPTKSDRLKFAFALVSEHGDCVADYIFAQFRHASTPAEMVRWDMLSQMIEEIIGQPLEVSYDVAARLAGEGVHIEIDENGPAIVPNLNRLPDC
ncbi:MAG: hypothetical protein PGN16_00020 [Sphingomonas phyllosphaerae]|uniref:hypothetical protein n=1 Tax=Sphingomonas phyllosphaerae TaxID=257003 RepID=UPI002FF70316